VPVVDLLPLGQLAGVRAAADVQGRLNGRLTLGGTRVAPVVDVRAYTDALRVASAPVDSLGLSARYAARRLDGALTLSGAGAPLLSSTAALPLDLALTPVANRQ